MTGRLPDPVALVQALAASAFPDRGIDGDHGGPILELALRLHENNRAQWDREDDARRADADDVAVASAKRDIDRLNGIRHRLIEAIDRAVLHAVPPVDEGVRAVTESPGMVIDRLSVLVLRLASSEARAAPSPAGGVDHGGVSSRVRSQLALLQDAARALFSDLERGSSRFVTYESLKLYGAAEGPDRR